SESVSAAPASRCRSRNATLAPFSTKARTKDAPMPLAPPVMITVRPSSDPYRVKLTGSPRLSKYTAAARRCRSQDRALCGPSATFAKIRHRVSLADAPRSGRLIRAATWRHGGATAPYQANHRAKHERKGIMPDETTFELASVEFGAEPVAVFR